MSCACGAGSQSDHGDYRCPMCVLHAIVTAADIQGRDGGAILLATLFKLFSFLPKLYADGGYRGPVFQNALKLVLSQAEVRVVKRFDHDKSFVVLPRRWVMELTLAWLNRCRGLTNDWESLNLNARAFLLLASIRLMVRRLCRSWQCFRIDFDDLDSTQRRAEWSQSRSRNCRFKRHH
jgi:transposase